MKTNLLIINLLILMASACWAKDDKAASEQIQIFGSGYHKSLERIDAESEKKMVQTVIGIAGRFPEDVDMTVEAVWQQINRRLREEKAGIEMVFETNFHPLKAKSTFFRERISKVRLYDDDKVDVRSAIVRANCFELLGVIVANTGFSVIYRKNTIILSNNVAG